jgi:hypothetical protein
MSLYSIVLRYALKITNEKVRAIIDAKSEVYIFLIYGNALFSLGLCSGSNAFIIISPLPDITNKIIAYNHLIVNQNHKKRCTNIRATIYYNYTIKFFKFNIIFCFLLTECLGFVIIRL